MFNLLNILGWTFEGSNKDQLVALSPKQCDLSAGWCQDNPCSIQRFQAHSSFARSFALYNFFFYILTGRLDLSPFKKKNFVNWTIPCLRFHTICSSLVISLFSFVFSYFRRFWFYFLSLKTEVNFSCRDLFSD